MSLQYSGGTLINRTFTPSTRADWVNNVDQACSDAGWTTISGTVGSGSDVLLESAANNNGAKIRMRFFDPGTGNCAQVTAKTSGLTSQISYALPAAGTGQWRVIADKYQFFAFATGSAQATTARGWIFGGTLYTPTFLSPPTDWAGWLYGASQIDTDSTARTGWRKTLRAAQGSPGGWSGIWGATIVEATGSTAAGHISIPNWQGGTNSLDQNYRWEDNSLPLYEALVGWATGSVNTNECKIKGQLYDSAVVNGSWTAESTVTLDGHNWLLVTDTPSANLSCLNSLILAVT